MSIAKVLVVAFSFAALVIPAAAAIVYDKPLSSEAITVPNKYGGAPISYTCYRYSTFIVRKQVYGGYPEGSFDIEPAGTKTCDPDVADRGYTSYGAQAGVIGHYVVVLPSNPDKPVSNFYLVDGRTRQLVLGDDSEGAVRSLVLLPDGVGVRYRRIYRSDCSLYYGAATACWTQTKAATGLADDMVPDCRPAYDDQRKKDGATGEKFNRRPSQIAYNVEVRFVGGKLAYTPLPGPVACKPLY